MRRQKSMTEKNNDSLLFWSYLGVPIYWVIGVIVVSLLFTIGFSIKEAIDKNEIRQEQKMEDDRQTIANKFIANNPGYFGVVTKQWSSGSFYYAESDKGKFTIAFNDQKISKIFLENKAGQMVTLYERED